MFPWISSVPRLREDFARARPFPHIVIDNFTDASLLDAIAREDFGDVGGDRWTYHRYSSQKTYSRTDLATFGSAARALLEQLASEEFRRTLSSITGIDGLLFDDNLEDGGLQSTPSSGYLCVHVDPLVHPRRRTWRRRVNLLVYLNADWQRSFGGDLELWPADMRACGATVTPAFNRAVLFAANEKTPHGFPDPLRSPAGITRNCIAIYYFTEEAAEPAPHFGRMYARPQDPFVTRAGIAFDNFALHVYGRLGQTLGINDRLVNRLMRPFRKRS